MEDFFKLSDEEFFIIVRDKIQKNEYMVVEGMVIDTNTNEMVCKLKSLGVEK